MTARIPPLTEPYEPAVAERLGKLSRPGVAPIGLFRTFVHNLPMAAGINAWGEYYLSNRLSLSLRDRELVIDRVTVRCGCEYEWGVHVARYAERADLTTEQIVSITYGGPSDPCWSHRDRLILESVDALHDTSTIDDALWNRLAEVFTSSELLDLLLLAGWYHAISYAANAARVELESWAPRFAELAGDRQAPTSRPVNP